MADIFDQERYDYIASQGLLSDVLRQPDYLERPDRYSSYIIGKDPEYADRRVAGLEQAGIFGNEKADYYGDLISSEGDDALSSGVQDAVSASSLGMRGAQALDASGQLSIDAGLAGSDLLTGYANESYASGLGAASDLFRRSGEAYGDILAPELARGPDTAEQQVLLDNRDKSLSAQRALAGSVRGLGGAQNTAMEDALIEGEAARNSDLLAAEQERAWQARMLEASKAYGNVALDANTAAANTMQEGLDASVSGYANAAATEARGARQQTDAFAKGTNTANQGFSNASSAVQNAGNTALSASNTSSGVQDRGRDALIKSTSGVLGVRDLEQRGGMASEDYLTDAYASSLGQISAANAVAANKEAAIVKGSVDAGTTLLTGLGDD